MPRPLRALGALLSVGLIVLGVLPGAADAGSAGSGAQTASIELVSQTPVAVAGEPFVATVGLEGVPANGSIAIKVHQRMRSRSELALSMEGDGLRCCVFQTAVAVSDLPAAAGGAREVALPLAPAPGGLPLPTEGVYPLELTAQDGAGGSLATLVTHLIVPPEAGDEAPNLAVAVVAELVAPLALQPDGSTDLSRADVEGLTGLAQGLAAHPQVPATLSVQPETVEALLGSTTPGDAAVVDTMRAAAASRSVLAGPWVPLDLDGLAEADLLGEVAPQRERGVRVLTEDLGVAPEGGVQLAPPTLAAEGLAVLAFGGVTRLVVDDDHVEPMPEGIISYSLAQPFVVAVPEDADVDERRPGSILALAPDPIVMERLGSEGSPGLVVSRVLAELALLRLEQPSVARASVLRLSRDLDAAVADQLVAAVGSGRPFEAVTLAGAFEHAAPVVDAGGNPVDRALQPDPADDIASETARRVSLGRADLATFTAMVGPDSELPDEPSRQLLAATAAGLDGSEREAHLDAEASAIEATAGGVSTPATFTLTLTARDGTIPLTIRNDAGVPLRVSIRLRSQKLEFPDGDTIDRTLTEETTRIDIRVRSRATGAFPLQIDVRTPDGRRSLSMSRYTVRSTAVSGAGLLLSLGAGVFLIVWWARHWRRTRRSQKLVAATSVHPSGSSPPASDGE